MMDNGCLIVYDAGGGGGFLRLLSLRYLFQVRNSKDRCLQGPPKKWKPVLGAQ